MPLVPVKQLKNAIEKLTKWERTGKAFGFIKSVPDDDDSYIYEFFCASSVLKDLSKKHEIELVKNPAGKYVFPRNPADKAGYSRFSIKDLTTGNELFQFCLGTNIRISDCPGTTFAADISIQRKNAKIDPDERDVILIMDAKYKINKSKEIDVKIIREFARCVADFKVPKDAKKGLKFDKLISLNSNCLFTNGKAAAKHEIYCRKRFVTQVGRFDCDGRVIDVVGW